MPVGKVDGKHYFLAEITRWYEQKDGSFSKIQTLHRGSEVVKVEEIENVSRKEYFRRKLKKKL